MHCEIDSARASSQNAQNVNVPTPEDASGGSSSRRCSCFFCCRSRCSPSADPRPPHLQQTTRTRGWRGGTAPSSSGHPLNGAPPATPLLRQCYSHPSSFRPTISHRSPCWYGSPEVCPRPRPRASTGTTSARCRRCCGELPRARSLSHRGRAVPLPGEV